MHLVDDPRGSGEPIRQPLGQLEAEVETMCAEVDEEIAGRGGGAVRPTRDCPERMQPGRARRAEEPLPDASSDADHARQPTLGDPEAHRAPKSTDVRQHIAYFVVGVRLDRQDASGGSVTSIA
jgi:hypothetical protein